eukprot:CAMPEP_0182895538 /NCGR_PEP_ID=MMETSP0034_2-20130328/25742_1 /TAXON_ID=156128 /ORGANISM="Nephroselmis pyriformis, Strain CCMP717" /LENGTH=271 /DNA_ID=CAMNT_0025029375 /DNA_START=226 /DNA_END=1037 /DNA_ORIENTATION=+
MAKTQDPTDMVFVIACIKGDQLGSNVQLTLDRSTAANTLWNLVVASESQRNKAYENGAIPALCLALNKGDAMCKHYCAGCLHFLAMGSREMKEEIINNKAVPALAGMLRDGTDNAAKSAACCIFEMAKDPVLSRQLNKFVDVLLTNLVYLVEANMQWSVGPAAGSLSLLSKDPACSAKLLEMGAVGLLIGVMKAGMAKLFEADISPEVESKVVDAVLATEEGRSFAAGTLNNMMAVSAESVCFKVADMLVQEGGLPPTVRLLTLGGEQCKA